MFSVVLQAQHHAVAQFFLDFGVPLVNLGTRHVARERKHGASDAYSGGIGDIHGIGAVQPGNNRGGMGEQIAVVPIGTVGGTVGVVLECRLEGQFGGKIGDQRADAHRRDIQPVPAAQDETLPAIKEVIGRAHAGTEVVHIAGKHIIAVEPGLLRSLEFNVDLLEVGHYLRGGRAVIDVITHGLGQHYGMVLDVEGIEEVK